MQGHRPLVTMAIIAACVAMFAWDVSQGAGATSGRFSRAADDFALWAPAVKFDGEWYRIFSTGFTHAGLMHIGFNMWILWQIGQSLEGRFGSLTFGTLYTTGLLGGSLGAMLVEPQSSVVGASGAVFAIMGALVVLQYMAGMNIMQSGLGRLLLLNVGITFLIPGISKGGHVGGLAIGLICGLILGVAQQQGKRVLALAPIAIGVVGLAAFLGLIPAIDRAANMFL